MTNELQPTGESHQSGMMREVIGTTLLRSIRDDLVAVLADMGPAAKSATQRIVRDIDEFTVQRESWQDFMARFNAIHGNFLGNLARDFPNLTPTELRLCAFLRLPMPSKDVAKIFHCSVRSIEKHRERMRKKFNLLPTQNLATFLASRIT